MKLVYGKENPLFSIVLVLSLIIWLAVIVGTIGIALIAVPIGFIIYVFAHSAYISYVRGNGVKLGPEQYPGLYAQVEAAAKKLGMESVPDAYLLNSNGVLNALATRFLWRNFMILYADIVNALDDRPSAVSFYIGHELGHITRGHLTWGPVLAPGKCFPYVGFAYRRAQEYTCDLHGLACCDNLEDAQRALVVLAAGKRRWKDLNLAAFGQQLAETGGFWMSFHELTSDYPWLVKRVDHVTAVAENSEYKPRRRSVFAWILAFFVLRAGPTGALGALIWIYIIGVMAAIAVPAYADYTARAQTSEGVVYAQTAEQSLIEYYADNNAWPTDLATANPDIAKPDLGRYTDTMTLLGPSDQFVGILVTFKTSGVTSQVAGRTFEVWTDDSGTSWHCGPGGPDPIDAKNLPPNCRDEGAP